MLLHDRDHAPFTHQVQPTAGAQGIFAEGRVISRTHAIWWFSFLLEASTPGHLEGGREPNGYACPKTRKTEHVLSTMGLATSCKAEQLNVVNHKMKLRVTLF